MFTRNHFRNQKVLVAGFGRFGACLPSSLQGFVIEGSAANVHVLDSCQAVLLAAARLVKISAAV